jgi:hypothetical protein
MQPCIVNRYKIPLDNCNIYSILSSTPGACTNDIFGSYRLGEILYDAYRYIGYHKLYYRPGHVTCDELLERAFNVKQFSIDQLPELLLPLLIKHQCISLAGSAVERLQEDIEQSIVEGVIKRQNYL